MRKNCQQVVKAFDNSKAAEPAESIWTDGETVYSYGTAILTFVPGIGHVLNRTQYSSTTSTHQNALAAEYARQAPVEVDDLRQGTTRQDLVLAATAKANGWPQEVAR